MPIPEIYIKFAKIAVKPGFEHVFSTGFVCEIENVALCHVVDQIDRIMKRFERSAPAR